MKKIFVWLSAILLLALVMGTLCSCGVFKKEERSVRTVEINEKGELVVIFTDGTFSNVGAVKGDRGDDGSDGNDGKDGTNGTNGTAGDDGDDGISVSKTSVNESGQLIVTYTDGTNDVIDLGGVVRVFEGKCGNGAEWALYNGGRLVFSGKGKTYAYKNGEAPWNMLLPLVNEVYVDNLNGLECDESLFYGIDSSIITYPTVWIDMAVSAPIYASPDKTSQKLADLPLGTAISLVSKGTDWVTVSYGGRTAYLESKYARYNDGSVVYTEVNCQLEVTRTGGATLRTYPDATSSTTDNLGKTVAKGTVLTCTGISQNKNWYRVTVDGQTLYAYKTWVTEK